jgi:hypothetical protein
MGCFACSYHVIGGLFEGRGIARALNWLAYGVLWLIVGFASRSWRSHLLMRQIDPENFIRRLAPACQLVGYDLEFCKEGRWYEPFGEAYFRFIPLSSADADARILTEEECRQAEALMRPVAVADTDREEEVVAQGGLISEEEEKEANTEMICVYVYGRSITAPKSTSTLFNGYDLVKHSIDMGTWGAIATEIMPLTEKYTWALNWTALILLLVPIFMLTAPPPRGDDMIHLLACLTHPVLVSSRRPVLECTLLEIMRSRVDRLSP